MVLGMNAGKDAGMTVERDVLHPTWVPAWPLTLSCQMTTLAKRTWPDVSSAGRAGCSGTTIPAPRRAPCAQRKAKFAAA